ncbi:MAG: hypothetical protein U0V04_00885 [Spirosomataceae bacterium]
MIQQYGYKEYSSKILLHRGSHSVPDGDTVGTKIVNWDLKCGTGTHFTVAYDLSNARI